MLLQIPPLPSLREVEIYFRHDSERSYRCVGSLVAEVANAAPAADSITLSLRMLRWDFPLWDFEPASFFASSSFTERQELHHQRLICRLEIECYGYIFPDSDDAGNPYSGFVPAMKQLFPGPHEVGILSCSKVIHLESAATYKSNDECICERGGQSFPQ